MAKISTKISTNYKARRAAQKPGGVVDCPKCPAGWLQYLIATDEEACPKCGYRQAVPADDPPAQPAAAPEYPAHWVRGQLLNVRHNGTTWILTLLEEEFDPHYPERAKFFDNGFDAQQFVSAWYARETSDPRAG
jgi:hypothetical protein